MKKPTPQDYGLTNEDVQRLSDVEERCNRTHERALSVVSTLVYCLWCFVFWVVSVITMVKWEWHVPRVRVEESGVIWVIWCSIWVSILIGGSMWQVFSVESAISQIIERLLRISTNRRHCNYSQYLTYKEDIYKFEVWFRRTQHEYWQRMSGRKFEYEVARLITKHGNQARVTGGSNDKGVDIVLDDGTVVQCKAHQKPVSPAVVRELYGAMAHFNAPRGILVSLNGFTCGVIEFVRDKPIELWDVNYLVRMQTKLAA